MANISKSKIAAIADVLIIFLSAIMCFGVLAMTVNRLIVAVVLPVIITVVFLHLKKFYTTDFVFPKSFLILLEAIVLSSFLSATLLIFVVNYFAIQLVLYNILFVFLGILFVRLVAFIYHKFFKRVKNILIIGAGQDGKLIAEEIQTRPELGMKIVGFLDDDMNNIEEEDSTIPILGLTYDSEAVIKDNNVDTVIIAVKSRMNSNILTDLAKGIPLGVKVWRMPTFYSYITKKVFTSKMAVNWLFYDFVKSKYFIYSYIKRFLDILMASFILLITLPLTLLVAICIKLYDFGPIFFTQIRTGKFEHPFKMIKFRTMKQDTVGEDFDDDLECVHDNDKRIIPFCRLIRKFRIDDIPQMINVIKGEMSLVGPRPVREDVYFQNKQNIPFWECRCWVRPAYTGWHQINEDDCVPEDMLGYDLYYIKRRSLLWDIIIFVKSCLKIITGRCK